MNKDTDYNPQDDLWKSIQEAFKIIRERVKAGGPGWDPHKIHPLTPEDKS